MKFVLKKLLLYKIATSIGIVLTNKFLWVNLILKLNQNLKIFNNNNKIIINNNNRKYIIYKIKLIF